MSTPNTVDGAAAATLLVVEDDPDHSERACRMLTEDGYRVVAAMHGREALERLRSEPMPALILLDLRMPVMDGWGFMAEMKQDPALASIPVIVTTQGGDRVLSSAPVAAGYLDKPIDRVRLLQTIALCLQRATRP
jgi:two-component system response regulator (stage 0 sporulation protein F)